jgi:hypothetical protein
LNSDQRPQLVPAASLEEADIVVTPKLVRGRYVPQIAAEMFHDRTGEWPGRCKWAVGQKKAKARNMFAHNHWQNLAADQRRDQPRVFGRGSYYETMDRAETAAGGRLRGMATRAAEMAKGLGGA